MKQTTKMIGSTPIPSQVQHLNRPEEYLLGNGLVTAGGSIDGRWSFIAGPHYTCSNYIKSEEIRLVIDGMEHAVQFDIHRARETGIYYGTVIIENIEVTLLDSTAWGSSSISRIFLFNNLSSVQSHNISIRASIELQPDSGIKAGLTADVSGNPAAITLCQDTSLFCTFGTHSGWIPNWADRHVLVAFTEPSSVIVKDENTYILDTKVKKLTSGKSWIVSLCHSFHYSDQTPEELLNKLSTANIILEAEKCILDWQQWFRNVSPKFSINKITDQRSRDIVEGGLVVIKTNQAEDGGIVANERWYNLSWTRDTYCGLRGLLACGHTEESKRFLYYTNHKYMFHGFIPNSASCGKDQFALYNGNPNNTPLRSQGGSCPEANTAPETTALYILAARDYFQASEDFHTLTEIHVSLKYSMDIQLKHASVNGNRLEFSGDETELCGAVNTSAAGYDHNLEKYWSMSSVALCIASLEFYIWYLEKTGENPASYMSIDGRIYNLPEELGKLKEAMDRDFWREDLIDSPEGFYDWCRLKAGNSFPPGRITNLSLFPIYHGTTLKYPERAVLTLNTIKKYFNKDKEIIPLVPLVGDERYLGHNLGYLLWCLIYMKDPLNVQVYKALVHGNSAQCWGSFNESYDADGKPNGNNLRTFETGVNIDAIAKYWGLG